MSEGARLRESFASLCLRLSDQRRPGTLSRGQAVACRRGRRPDAGAANSIQFQTRSLPISGVIRRRGRSARRSGRSARPPARKSPDSA